MKIAFIIQFNYPQFGGLFFSATSRIKYFTEENKDFDVSVFNIRVKPPLPIRMIRYLVTRSRFYPEISYFNELQVINLYYSLSLEEYFKRKIIKHYDVDYTKLVKGLRSVFDCFDLVAAHYGNGPGEFALYLSEATNKKFTVTYHGSDIHTTPFLNETKYSLYKKMLEKSSANIFVSKALLNTSLEILNSNSKNYVLYDGIDFNQYRVYRNDNVNKLKENLRLGNKVVGFVGNLIAVKNVNSLVGIFLNTKRRFGTVSFIIIGEGNLKRQLQKAFDDLGIEVSFLGNIQQAEMHYYYNLMDVLVLPSKNEGLGRVIVEALACGVNCVGSKVGGIPELLPEENTFPLGDTFELLVSNRIVELLNSTQSPLLDKEQFNSKKNAISQGKIYRDIFINKFEQS